MQSPFNTQNYNRYSYVINNPLSLNDPSGYCYGGPDSISQMMMDLASQQIESMHIANVMDTMRSINNYSVNKAISNATNKLMTELGLKFNDDKTLIVDRNGKAFLSPAQAKLDRASGESSNSTEATSVSATQVAGASVGGASSNGALTDVLGGDVNQGSAIARKWSTEGSPVDYFTVSEVGGASGMDSNIDLVCGIKCQLHAVIHGWGNKSSLSVRQVYGAADIGTYIGMLTPTGFLVKQTMRREATVSIFKAPQRGKGGSQYMNGYEKKDFCDGDQCAYFAADRSLAEEYAKHYGEGVIELKIPLKTYNSRMRKHEYLYQGGPQKEIVVPHSEFDVLNNAERLWHK